MRITSTLPPPPEEADEWETATTSDGRIVYTTVVEEHNTYITNPTTIIRESSGGGGGSSDGVSRDLFRRQIEVVFENIGERIDSFQDDLAEAVNTITLAVSGNASVGGNLDVVGTLTAGLLSVSSVSSGSVVEAPYFTATSTSQASTFTYASTTALSVSGLTSGRVPYLGTGGIFRDLSSFTFDGTTLTAPVFTSSSVNATSTFAGAVSIGGIALKGNSSANNFIINADINLVDEGTTRNTIGGGGSNPARNIIGTTGLPFYNDFTPTDWAADSAYIDNSANVAVIAGGYDNIVNQEAGAILGGGHNFMKYNSNGHSVIGGGSYNLISAGRSGIFSGRRNTITGASQVFSYIGGGDDNNIVGSYSVISGGRGNDVSGDYSFAFGRRAQVSVSGAVAFADSADADFTASVANQFAARYSGGYRLTGGRLQVADDLAADGTLAQFYDSTSDMALDIRSNTGGSGLATKHIDIMGISSVSDLAFSPSSDTRRALVIKDGGNVGIGTTTPNSKLQVITSGNGFTTSAQTVASFQRSSVATSDAIVSIIAGNTANSYLSFGDTDAENMGRIRYNHTNNTLGFGTNGNTDNALIDSSGRLGIGTTTPWRTLSVAGTAAFSGLVNDSTGYYVCLNTTTGQMATSTTACGASSERFKENITNIGYGLDAVNALRPVSFTYKDSYIQDAPPQLGFIAEEVELVIPELVAKDASGTIQGLDYPKFTAVIVRAIQEIYDMLAGFAHSITSENLNATERLCVGQTCITESELIEILDESGQDPTPTPPAPEPEAPDTDAPTDEEPPADETVSEPEPLVEEPALEPTPEPASEPAPESP